MCIVPYAIIRKKYNVTIKDLGLGRLSLYDFILVVVTIAVGVAALIIGGASFNLKLLNITLHFLWISIGEEFLSRGCVFYCFKKITNSKWIIVTVSAFIFAFGLHMGGDLMDNITIRLPLGLVFAVAYAFTNRLYLPIALHWVYDVAIDYIVLLF
jgi:membrane protease YdiL (CAAX protease family)